MSGPSGEPVLAAWRLGPAAYLPWSPLWAWLFAACAVAAVHFVAPQWQTTALVIAFAAWLLTTVYRLMYNASVVLYMDRAGVWVARGILPWNSGVYGVKWRDMESVAYRQNLSSWLTRSFTITVVERFTQASEMRIRHVWHGDEASTLINKHLIALSEHGILERSGP